MCGRWVVAHSKLRFIVLSLYYLGKKKRITPKPTKTVKFSDKGGFTKYSLANVRAPCSVVNVILKALNYSLAANSWKSYRTVENHILRIREFFLYCFPAIET